MYSVLNGGFTTRHPKTYRMSRPNGLTNYVLLIIRTSGEFDIDGTQYSVTPGQALILAPNTPYAYGNAEGEYIDDWLHFMPEDASAFEMAYPMINRPFPIGNTELFTFMIKQVLWENSYTDVSFAAENIDSLLTVMFNHLLAAFNEPDTLLAKPFSKELKQIRLDLQNTPSDRHSIEEYSAKLGISKSYFQHLYTDLFGISFQQDVIKQRIERAKFIISTTDLPLEQVAEICGYSSEVHFYRQFKQMTSITPAKFRKIGR